MTLAKVNILPSTRDSHEKALRLVFGNIGSTEGASTEEASTEDQPLPAALTKDAEDEPADLNGLFEARVDDKLVGAVWVQLMPGKTAVLWPPNIAQGENEETRRALMRPVLDYVSQHELSMVQTLVDSRSDPRCPVLVEAGFEHLVDLQYLLSLESRFPTAQPSSAIQFVPSSQASRQRLATVVEQTYSETRDCPGMCGVRCMDDVLEGYEKTGVFSPERWWIVRHASEDIGCLLLTDHPTFDYLELLYMGVVPSARGNGWGREIIQFAQWQTRLAKRTRLVLAVDADNHPALAGYEACGFVCWDQKTVYWRQYSR